MNEKLNKNSIYLKSNFCNNIHYRSKAWGQYVYLFFERNSFLFSKDLLKLIAKIDIVRKHLYFE